MKRYVANKADQQGIFRGDRKEEIGKYKIKFDSVQAKNFKNCNPLGIQKKKKYRIHFHNKYYNQDK